MQIYSNINQVLRTVKPVDGVVGLRCSAEHAERTWYNAVSRNDRKDFELVVVSAPHGCNVFVRPWSNSGVITGGGPSWVFWLIIAILVLNFVGVMWYV